MPREIPIALQQDLASGATTMCVLLKIVPVQPGFDPFGVTTLDTDITFDDGNGPLLYSAAIGTEVSTLRNQADLSVGGGEAKQLMPLFDTPADEADIAAGAYDYAKFFAYMVNYEDLSKGFIKLQKGTTGRNTVTESGLSWTTELRGLTQNLKQTITEKWSISCRAVFGSQESSAQSRYPCLFDAEALWQSSVVTDVGLDTTQQFTATGLTPTYGGVPGLVRWTSGANAGRTDEAESFNAGVIGLTFGSSYPIAIGDEFDFRDDCPKTPEACKARNNWQNYRGEPTIPVADNGSITIGHIGGVAGRIIKAVQSEGD